MPKPKRKPLVRVPEPSPWLSRALIVNLVTLIVLATWAFVNIGSSGPTRYDGWGAEMFCVLAAATAGCAWLAYRWNRHGATGMFAGQGLVFLFLLTDKPKQPQALPGGESMLTLAMVLVAALGVFLYILVRPVWERFESP